MKKLLFVVPKFHEKTGSSLFMLELLRERYEVSKCLYDLIDGSDELLLNQYKNKKYDVLVCWQVLLTTAELKQLNYVRGVLFPMFDACPSVYKTEKWLPYRNFTVISFSKILYAKLLKIGLHVYFIKYFPQTPCFVEWGSKNKIFFWNRRRNISFPLIESLFSKASIESVHWHCASDPGETIIPPSIKNHWKVKKTGWYQEKASMLCDIQNAAYYIAPRMREGIGMSFLEAMGAGRCVVAPNLPTMNEYIQHGETGLLYDPSDPQPFSEHDLHKIQKQSREFCSKGRQDWDSNKNKIFQWLLIKPRFKHHRLIFWFCIRFFRNPVKCTLALINLN